MSIRVNIVPAQELPLLRKAVEHYGFDSTNQFLRVACRTLIEHYRRRQELATPLRFYGNGAFEAEIARLDSIIKDLQERT